MPNNGFISLHRKILDWEWYEDINVRVLFFHLLLKANYEDKNWKGILISRGQFITSLAKLAEETSLSVSMVRVALNKLKTTHEVTHTGTRDYSVITITNYDKYQYNDKPNDTQVTHKRHANDTLMTTTNNNNKENNKNKDTNVPLRDTSPSNWKEEYGERYIAAFNKLFDKKTILTPARLKKLKARFKTFTSDQIAQALINLSNSKFHQGDNSRGWKADPDFLIRSDEQVDNWLNNGGKNEK